MVKGTREESELIIFGGEKEVQKLELTPPQRRIFDRQSLVLSYYRELGKGDLPKAVKKAKATMRVVGTWRKENLLGFDERLNAADVEIGARLMSGLVEKIEAGDIKNPTIVKIALKRFDSVTFGDDAGGGGSETNILRQMAEDRRKFMDTFEHQVDAVAEEKVRAILGDTKDPRAKELAKQILKLKDEYPDG